MSNEIIFYDASVQSSARSNKCYAPNTLYEYPQNTRNLRLTLRLGIQPGSLRTQLQGASLQDRVDRIPRDRADGEKGRREGDQS